MGCFRDTRNNQLAGLDSLVRISNKNRNGQMLTSREHDNADIISPG
jgi:hypothetical protein